MAETMDKDIAELRKDIAKLKADLKAAAGESGDILQSARDSLEAEAARLMEKLQQRAGSVGENLAGAAQTVSSNVRSAANAALDQGEQFVHSVEGRIEEKPLQSALLTFGAGFLLGWIVSRK